MGLRRTTGAGISLKGHFAFIIQGGKKDNNEGETPKSKGGGKTANGT